MAFFQAPPTLSNPHDDDALFREYLARALPAPLLAAHTDELRHLGELAVTELLALQLAERSVEPVLTQWDPWGHRVDDIELTPLWRRGHALAAEHGLVARAYDPALGPHARVVQFALNYMVQASLDVYSCPLAMTDGAARTLLDLDAPALVERAVPHLLSRDPRTMWTSGQWMTERTGGSDVGLSETEARKDGDTWRLYGTKWFTSAATSEIALTLARPTGNPAGGRGLALFYLETRGADGRLQDIQVNRLKDKLGTRKVPTAELTLDGTPATPVAGLDNGVRNIASMLNVTRLWNAFGANWGARRCVALVRSYAEKRVAFGAPLADKPLHVDTVAGLAAEQEALFHLAFRAAELVGRVEAGEATADERDLVRLMTPIVKLTTGKQAVAIASESLEAFGGAGYVEDTGLPLLLRDAQVLPIWEGTTNVLSLDLLRALVKTGGEAVLAGEMSAHLAGAGPELRPCVEAVTRALAHAGAWFREAAAEPSRLEAGARRFALTLGRALQLSLMVGHATWAIEAGHGRRALVAARRFASHGVDLIQDGHDVELGLLARGA